MVSLVSNANSWAWKEYCCLTQGKYKRARKCSWNWGGRDSGEAVAMNETKYARGIKAKRSVQHTCTDNVRFTEYDDENAGTRIRASLFNVSTYWRVPVISDQRTLCTSGSAIDISHEFNMISGTAPLATRSLSSQRGHEDYSACI